MKSAFAILLSLSLCTAAFGQGKLQFGNDSAHLVTMTGDTNRLFAPDFPLAGQPVPPGGHLLSGINLVVDLYAAAALGKPERGNRRGLGAGAFGAGAGRRGRGSAGLACEEGKQQVPGIRHNV